MFAARNALRRASTRSFATTSARAHDVSKLILVGRLGRDPEVRTTKSDKEYVSYTVATTNYPPPPANPDGTRREATTSWHQVVSFSPSQIAFLRTVPKGSQVYVEANFELRDADPTADPSSPQAHRQIFLRHENLRVLKRAESAHESSE